MTITARTNAYWLRMQIGKTAREVCAATGLAYATLANIEAGDRPPSAPVVARVCTYYGVAAPALLSYDTNLIAEKLAPQDRAA